MINYQTPYVFFVFIHISFCITLLLPGMYVAIVTYHEEVIPTELLFSIVASRSNVPFMVIVEILLMEVSFEVIREAGLRAGQRRFDKGEAHDRRARG